MCRAFDSSIASRLLGTACLALLAACAYQPAITSQAGYSDTEHAASVNAYRVEFADTPDFLKPMLRDEVSQVLAAKGIAYTEGEADAVLLMTFVNEPLPSDVELAGTEAGDGATSESIVAARFNARVELEMRDSVTGERIWSGWINRRHYVPDGAYMHEAPARQAMREAFAGVFANWPGRPPEDRGPPDY